MDEAKRILFESPTYLYIALAVAELALAVMWYERRSRTFAILLAVPVLLAGGVFVTERLVVTDREKMTAAVNEIATDLEAGDFDVLADYIDDEFSAGGFLSDKKAAIARVRMEITRNSVTRLKITRVVINIGGQTAKMRAGVTVSGQGYSMPVLLNIYWIKRSDDWRIIRADEAEIGVEF